MYPLVQRVFCYKNDTDSCSIQSTTSFVRGINQVSSSAAAAKGTHFFYKKSVYKKLDPPRPRN